MLAKVPNKKTETVVNALIEQAHPLPTELYKSLTWDRGLEMADHKRFTLATNIAVYFCDPRSPWQRGSNENTNGLLRYYFPKRTNLSVRSQEHLDAVARQLTSGHARRWSSQLRQKHLMHVLHRPVEPADIIIHIVCALFHLRICRAPAAPTAHYRWSGSAKG